MFNPPPMDSMDASVENSTFPPPSMSPPPMDNFSPDKEFSPPPLDDFSPSKEFSPPSLLGGGKAFSPPPLDDFSPSKEVPPLQFSPPFFGGAGNGVGEDRASKGGDFGASDIFDEDFDPTLEIEGNNIKFDEILQMKPREILELKEESEKCTNFMSSLSAATEPKENLESAISSNSSTQPSQNQVSETEEEPRPIESASSQEIVIDTNIESSKEELPGSQSPDDQVVNEDNDGNSMVESIDELVINKEVKTKVESPLEEVENKESEPMRDHLTLTENKQAEIESEPLGHDHDVEDQNSDSNNSQELDSIAQRSPEQPLSNKVGSIDDLDLDFGENDNDFEDDLIEEKTEIDMDTHVSSVNNKDDDLDQINNGVLHMEEQETKKEFVASEEDFFASFPSDNIGNAANGAADNNEPSEVTADDWGNFNEDTIVEKRSNFDDDDDFGDFDDFESAAPANGGQDINNKSLHILDDLLKKVDASLEKLVQSVFTEEQNDLNKTQEDIQPLNKLVFQDARVWGVIEDPASTPALDFVWPESNIYSLLLNTLCIDRNVVLDGENWRRNIPRNKNGTLSNSGPPTTPGGILQPTPVTTSAPLKPTQLNPSSNNNPSTTSLDNDINCNESHVPMQTKTVEEVSNVPANVDNDIEEPAKKVLSEDHVMERKEEAGVTNVDTAENLDHQTEPVILPIISGQVDLHSPDFDWSLPDPDPGASSGLQQSSPVNNSTEGNVMAATINNKDTTLLEDKVKKTLDAFPLLNFMQSPVLILPTRSPNPVRRMKTKNTERR